MGSRPTQLIQKILTAPILWGAVASGVFYWLLQAGMLGSYFLPRYCAGHVVQYIETSLFFVGLSALLLKGFDMARQLSGLHRPLLGAVPAESQTTAHCRLLLDRLNRQGTVHRNDYLIRRYRETIEHIARRGSAASLDEQLRHLSGLDAERAYGSSALIRLIIWAIPILGFLGTVVGITMAIASLKVDAVQESMMEVTAGLGVKFDTTALALTLSIVLMFLQYVVDRIEAALLAGVDQIVETELIGRFPPISGTPEGHVVAMQLMSEAMIESLGNLVRQQAELWQNTMNASWERWTAMADSVNKHLETGLTTALQEGLRSHAAQLAASEDATAEKNRQQWNEVQKGLAYTAHAFAAMQAALTQRANILGQAVDATAYVAKLEEALNHNLSTLAGAKHFEETVLSLSATIQLLNARLGSMSTAAPSVQLDRPRRTGQAA